MDDQPTGAEAAALQDVGATAVDAASLEQNILRQVEQATATGAGGAATIADAQLEQLWAVRREVRAVRAAIQRMERPPDEAEGSAAAGESAGAELPQPAPLERGELHQAVMRERLAGLEAEAAQLEHALAAMGAAAPPVQPTAEELQQVLLQSERSGRGRSGKKPKNKAATVQFDLEEADLFETAAAAAAGKKASLVETERDRLIRLGVLTPFDRLGGFERRVEGAPGAGAASGVSEEAAAASIARVGERVRQIREERHQTQLLDASELPRPQRQARRVDEGFWRASASGSVAVPKKRRVSTLPREAGGRQRRRRCQQQPTSDAEFSGSEDEEQEGGSDIGNSSDDDEELTEILDATGRFDDADDEAYRRRQKAYKKSRRKSAAGAQRRGTSAYDAEVPVRDASEGSELKEKVGEGEDGEENLAAGAAAAERPPADVAFQGGFRVPGDIYAKLFDYQRTGVKWLWELHTQRAGGIIGDEMGLGKTIQIVAFLAGLHHSGMFKPTLIVVPATVLNQWLRELRAWYPPFRVAILHDSAAPVGQRGAGAAVGRAALVRRIAACDTGILLTTYEQLRLRRGELLGVAWGCAILDEGHKIRNPDAEITLVAKQLPTVHRLIMTGSPIQNRLTELWSLFDFVFPGKLGTLPVFQAEFAVPIQIGGYTNASPLQVAAAYRCAVVLRDLISPYLLRRRKADVAKALPKKTERVLFCSLTQDQRDMYRSYLASKELGDILAGNRAALAGIDVLRKICNHPDLLERAKWEATASYGAPERSGKLMVLQRVLEHWHEAGHKALIFTQTQQMLDILERLVISRGWRHHRLDGGTPIASRPRLIDDFNNNPEIFVFLLTTRVGGLGINLTGANRCVIFDPDWNPSTDAQARERAWRIGQSREVTVYRLITSGTIEEKVYHRQVYKQFLTERVLSDPRQKRFFKARDLADLFTLGDEYAEGTETAEIFATLDTEIRAEDLPAEAEGNGGGGDTGGEGAAVAAAARGVRREGTPSDQDEYRSGAEDGASFGARIEQQQPAVAAAAAPTDDVPNTASEAAGGGGDAKILRDLFEGTGVHAALDHDKIEGAHDPSHRMAEREATKIAAKAAAALRQSRMQLQTAPVNQPTWTGRSGAAGAPRFGSTARPSLPAGRGSGGGGGGRFGGGAAAGGGAPRSSDLLAQVRQRQAAAVAAATPEVSRARTMAERIAEFLHRKGGAATSDDVAAAFRREVGAGDAALFRGVLKQVAKLERRMGGKVWALREEFLITST